MASWDRFEVEGSGLEVNVVPHHYVEGYFEYLDHALSITFTPRETFAQIIKRWARQQEDAQIKLAVSALENEMGARLK